MRERWNSLSADARLAIRWTVIIAVVLLVAVGGVRLLLGASPPPRRVTIDGGGLITKINLWDNYETRHTVSGWVGVGEAVDLIRQSGAGCLIQTSSGQQGWVTCAAFIKEFK